MNQRQHHWLDWTGIQDNWQRFSGLSLLLMGLMLAVSRAAPVSDAGLGLRLLYWTLTAAAVWVCLWMASQAAQRLPLSAGWPQLLASSLLTATLFTLPSLGLDALFGFEEEESGWMEVLKGEIASGFLPVMMGALVAQLPTLAVSVPSRTADLPPTPSAAALPTALGGQLLKIVADLQYLHVHTDRGMATVPGPLRDWVLRHDQEGMQINRSVWIADRQVRQLKSTGGRWLCVLHDGERIAVSRRRVADARLRYGDALFAAESKKP